jgi:hypothetical protein
VALTTIVVELYEAEAILGQGPRDPIRGAFRDSLQVLTTSAAGLVHNFGVPDTVVLMVGFATWAVRAIHARGRRAARGEEPASRTGSWDRR